MYFIRNLTRLLVLTLHPCALIRQRSFLKEPTGEWILLQKIMDFPAAPTFINNSKKYLRSCSPLKSSESNTNSSLLVRRLNVKSSILVSSAPIISGERNMHHSVIMVFCSSLVNRQSLSCLKAFTDLAEWQHIAIRETALFYMILP